MALNISINDTNGIGIPNITVELWGTSKVSSSPQTAYQKLHTGTFTTNASGVVSIVTTVNISEFNDSVDIKLYYQSSLVKTISGLSLDSILKRGYTASLIKNSGNNGTISGTVTHSVTNNPIGNVKVDLWIKNGSKLNSSDILTNSSGQFSFDVNNLFFSEKHTGKTVIIELYYNNTLEHSEEILVSPTLFSSSHNLSINIDLGGVSAISVSGTVKNVFNDPLEGYILKVFSVSEEKETFMDQERSEDDGSYTVNFDHVYSSSSKKFPKIKVKVVDPDSNSILYTSSTIQLSNTQGNLNITVEGIQYSESRTISGRVANSSNVGLKNVSVKLFKNNSGTETLIGSASTNNTGAYSITYNVQFTTVSEKALSLSLKAYDLLTGEELIVSSPQSISTQSSSLNITIDPTLDVDTTVQGSIKDLSNQPLYNYRVTAYMKRSSGDIEIESTRTLSNGHYEIPFTCRYVSQLNKIEGIYIKVFHPDNGTLMATSDLNTNIDSQVVIDMTLNLNPSNQREVYGKISQNGKEIYDYFKVEAYAIDSQGKHILLGEADTGKSDLYSINYNYSDSFGSNGSIRVFIKVYDKATNEWLGTSIILTNSLNRQNIDYTVDVLNKNCKVFGTVVNELNQPLNNYIVEAYTMNSDKEVKLGDSTTNASGYYKIDYNYPYDKYQKAGITLLVKLVDNTSHEVLLTSPLFLNADIEEEINLALSDTCFTRPLYDLINDGLSSVTFTKSSDQLTKNDLTVLAKETGLAEEDIAIVKVAKKYATESSNTDAKVFYALFKQSGDKKLSSILMQKKSRLKSILLDAVKNGLVDKSVENNIDQTVNNIQDYAASLITSNSNGLYNQILGIGSLTSVQKLTFLKKYLSYEGDDKSFWTELSHLLPSDKITEIKELLNLCNISYNNFNFVDETFNKFTVYQLAQKTQANWDNFIDDNSIPVPNIFKGDREYERRNEYAQYIKNSIEVLYPTESVVAKIEVDNDISIPNLKQFYENNEDFDFYKEDFEDGFAKSKYTLTNIPTDKVTEIKCNLKTIQRLFVVSPAINKFDIVKELYNQSLHSPLAITKKGKGTFTTLMEKASIDAETSGSVYSKAEALTFKALMFFAHYTKDIKDSPRNLIYSPDKQNVLEDIFGSLDYCGCSHCQSVYSPAAYLADILNFLKRIESNTNPFTALTENRRPDLKEINLNCQNTNTLMPFIDLVNEILENAVAGNSLNGYQTTSENEDISCYPEHLNIAAYDNVKDERYPWHAPFHLWNEEARAYLDHLNINRSDILNDVPAGENTNVNNQYYIDKIVASEYLNIDKLDLITYDHTESNPTFTLEDIYGAGATVTNLKNVETLLERSGIDYDTLKELIQSNYINPVDPHSKLRKGIDFNKDAPCDLSLAKIQFNENEFKKLNKFWRLKHKLGWTVSELDKTIQAFPFTNPDNTLSMKITDDFVINCYFLKKIRENYNIPVVEIISWWNDMDIDNHFENEDSLYNEIYLNKALENESIDFNLGNTTNIGTGGNKDARAHTMASLSIVEADLNRLLPESGPYICSLSNLSDLYKKVKLCKTLGITTEEYIILLDLMDKTDNYPFANPQETSEFIAELEKIKESGWTIHDLYYLLKGKGNKCSLNIKDEEISLFLEDLRTGLTEIREKYIISRTSISDFIDEELNIENLDTSTKTSIKQLITGENKLNTAELNTLISSNSSVFNSFNLSSSDFSDINTGSDDNIYKAISNIGNNSDSNQIEKLEEHKKFESNLRTLLSLFIESEDLVKDAINIIKSWANPENEENQEKFIDKYFVLFLNDTTEVKDKLKLTAPPSNSRLKTELARMIYLTNELVKKLMEDFIYQKFADALELELSTIKKLFTNYFYETRILKSFSTFFHRYSFVSSEEKIERSTKFNLQFFYFEAIYKAALFIKHYQLSQTDIDVIHYDFSKTSWLKFTSLPGQPETNANNEYLTHVNYEKWSKFENAIRLNNSLFDEELSFFEFLNQKLSNNELTQNNWFENLTVLNNWDLNTSDLTSLSNSCNFSNFVNDFNDERWLIAVEKVMKYAIKLQVNPLQLILLNKQKLISSESGSYRKLVKSTMTNNQWLEVAPKIRKPLREKQRNALASYLISKTSNNYKDTTDLYNYYLIDTEMSSCAMTSRIKQAILSVQLFVQRAIMGLEGEDIVIGDTSKDEWEWAKQYRLWEANRKIFVQPENYLEPDLRKDKSELFEEVEKLLKEDDVTDESVDRIYKTYLNGLSDISNLEICDISANHVAFNYKDVNQNLKSVYLSPGKKSNTTHLLGRTKQSPHTYYYRKFEKNIWSPWEKIDIEITGENVVIVEYHSMLFIAWLEFTEKGVEKAYKEGQSLERSMEIRLAWTYRNNGKWTSKKLSKEHFDTKTSSKQYSSSHCLNGANSFNDKSIYNIRPSTPWGESFLYFNVFIDAYYTSGQCPDNGNKDCTPENYENQISELCRFVFKSPFSEPSCNYSWDKTRKKDQNAKLVNGGFVIQGFNDWKGSNPHKQLRVSQNKPFSKVNLYEFIWNQDYKLIYPSSLSNQFKDMGEDSSAYYSQDPLVHQDKDRCYLIMPEKAKPIGDKSKLEDMIYNDIYDAPILTQLLETNSQSLIQKKVFFDKSKSTTIVDRSKNQINIQTNFSDADLPEDVIEFENAKTNGSPCEEFKYRFYRLFHPYIEDLFNTINFKGIESLLSSKLNSEFFRQKGGYRENIFQSEPNWETDNGMFKVKNPTIWVSDYVVGSYPNDEISFNASDSYSIYNWEIFFHIPMLIADKLMKNKRFEEAQKWYHYIFDPGLNNIKFPNGESSPVDYWKVKPLVFTGDNMFPSTYEEVSSYTGSVESWRKDPFNPHKIAFTRPIAYRKNVFMKYLDNLIAWGDHLFAQDTMESINEATQLYIMAANLLGKKPVMARKHEPEAKSYENLSENFDDFSNAIITVTDMIWKNKYAIDNDTDTRSSNNVSSGVGHFISQAYEAYYFGFPNNDKLMSYWDTVADRLFKIRHCMNIKGVERQLALFAPPIDPALIAKALAGGLSLGEALNELNAPQSYYRFQTMYQKAMEITNDVKSLGQSLLSVLEKKDAESLSILRAGHELKLQSAIKQLKELSIDENDSQIKSLEYNKLVVEKRMGHYQGLIDTNLIKEEQNHLDELEKSNKSQINAQDAALMAQVYAMYPDWNIGASGGIPPVHLNTTFGGTLFSQLANMASTYNNMKSSEAQGKASKASIVAGHERRAQEWKFQVKTAEFEIGQIDKQIVAAEIRKAMAEKELANHELQTEQSEEYFEFLKDKYTNEELYSWMSGQISNVYFQSYQMAVELAKKAQRSYIFETSDYGANFISYGNWDSMKKGLLAGEKLQADLRKMDLAYMERNKRRLELTKNVSLAMLNAEELMDLRETGSCYIDIPEVLFDLDYPGQYQRRIKSVSITIPAVTGPNTNISCKLSLMGSRYRKNSQLSSNIENPYIIENENDSRFLFLTGGMESIATSSAQKDSGMFQFNFNDERYLPFEGAGAISKWKLELPETFRQFDYDSIGDVILHINYTAFDDATLETKAKEHMGNSIQQILDELKKTKTGLLQMISMKAQFANNLNQLINEEATSLTIFKKHFPYFLKDKNIKIDSVENQLLTSDTALSLNTIGVTSNEPDGKVGVINVDSEMFYSPLELDDVILIVKYSLA